MTVCIGYLDNDGIAHIITDGMGSNALSNSDGSYQKVHVTKDENLLMAYAGRFDNLELRYYSYLPDAKFVKADDGDGKYIKELPSVDDEYFFTKFRYKLRDKMNKIRFHYNKKGDKSEDYVDDVSMLIAHEGLLYKIQSNYELLPIENGTYTIIGSGSWHGEGAMNLSNIVRPDLPVRDRLVEVIKSISESVVSVGKKYYYANTDTYDVEVIEE